MKKLIVGTAIILGLISYYKSPSIPKESIRFRIIANSNQEEDQKLKKEIVNTIAPILIKKKSTIEEERNYIEKNLPVIENQINKLVDRPYKVEYGQNYFPEKEYKGEIFEEGNYESLVITIGEGKGDNFWCILFPPLCMIEEEDTEYESLLKEAFNKIIHIE